VLGVYNLPVHVCADARAACDDLGKGQYSTLLMHLGENERDQDVLPVLWALTSTRQSCATLVLGSHLTEEQIANLLRAGVADCLNLPEDLSRLPGVLEELVSLSAPDLVPEPAPALVEEDSFEACTPDLVALMGQVRRVAPQETTLLLTGETGTGKTRLARLIHEMSPRREQPFLVVDCGSLSATLIESELFGHARGPGPRPGARAGPRRGGLL